MEPSKRQDDMEEFFRKAFDELGDTPSPDGWDVPSAQTWAGIRAGLAAPQPGPPRRRGALLLPLLLLLLGLALWWQNQRMAQQLEEQAAVMRQLQASLDSLQAARGGDWFEAAAGEAKISEQRAATPWLFAEKNGGRIPWWLRRPAEARVHEQGVAGPAAAPLPARTVSSPPLLAGRADVAPLAASGSTAPQLAAAALGMTVPEATADLGAAPALLLALEALPLQPLHSTTARAAFVPNLPPLILPQAARSVRPGFYLGGYVAYNQTSRVVDNRSGQPGRALFEAQENGRGALEGGLRAGVQLSRRWALESGLSAFSLQQESRQAFRVQYDPGRERPVGGGQVEATYALAVPSAYGTSEVEIDLRRAAGQRMLPGTHVAIEVHAQQRLRFVSIPLSARCQVLEAGRFQLGVKAGLALSFLRSSSLHTAVQSRRAGLDVLDTRVRERFTELRSTNLDYLVGLSAHYRLASRWGLAVEPTYRQNLQPLAEGLHFASSAYAWGLQAGLNYRF
jgi:hypothetical protein